MSELKEQADVPDPSTWRIVKNVVVISLAFMLHFTAYSGAANLQSSINAQAGLGTASLAAVYAGLICSNVFLPVIVIKWLGTKWGIALSFLAYMPYIAAQLWPTFYTLIPAGIIVGLGGGPLWCSKCTYLTIVSEAHSKISNIPVEALLTRFLGLFFMIFQMHQVWGNLISSLVISSGDNQAAVTAVNESMIPVLCGASFLPNVDASKALQPQPPEKIQIIAGIYLVCMACASIIVAVGVDSTKRFMPNRPESGNGLSGLALLAVTVKFFAEPYQMMLIIINIFIGLQQAFFGSDFTAAFVSCAFGTGTLGFVIMTYGVFSGIGSVITGYLSKVIGRVSLITAATVIHTCLLTTLLVWRPRAEQVYVLYILVVFWGLSDSVWKVQILAFCGVLFKGNEEIAFSNFSVSDSMGFVIGYIISPYFQTRSKTYLVLALMFVGVGLYYIVEYKEYKIKKKAENTSKELCYIREGTDNIAFQHME